ncbi:MAG: Nif3-like dinuclear metal center hexameric protein [Planctomycetes bacterium]|nr:Nif3-like dinuclear metal center hexameric protein [Planctomycetota bacterium]
MIRLAEIVAFLEELAPPHLAEEWDNVGLLVGDRARTVGRAMTCLTLSQDVAREAIAGRADLVVTHHPVLFRAVKRLTADDPQGRVLLELIEARVAVYSPHTGYDSAAEGINRQLAELLELSDIGVLRPPPLAPPDQGGESAGDVAWQETAAQPVGGGRYGRLNSPLTLRQLAERVKQRLNSTIVQFAGEPERRIERVAVGCGSAAEFLSDALALGCEAFVTGEARFHAALEARSSGIALIVAGHYATERPAMETLARRLAERFPTLEVWASRDERDPLEHAV